MRAEAVGDSRRSQSRELFQQRRASTLPTALAPNVYSQRAAGDAWTRTGGQSAIRQIKALTKRPTGSSNSRVVSVSPLRAGAALGDGGRESQALRGYARAAPPQFDLARTLARTRVGAEQRTRMVDWLLEVVHSFRAKCGAPTFFRAVMLFDAFLKYALGPPIEESEIHLIGAVCVFVASKYEEIRGLSIAELRGGVLYDRFSTAEIVREEARVLGALGFRFSYPTLLDWLSATLYRLGKRVEWRSEERRGLADRAEYVARLMLHFAHFNAYTYELLAIVAVAFVLRCVRLIDRGALLLRARYQSPNERSANDFGAEREALNWLLSESPAPRPRVEALCVQLRREWDRSHSDLPRKNLMRIFEVRFEFVDKF